MDKDILLKVFIDHIIYWIEPVEIILFGSFASGKHRTNSDIDLLIVTNQLHKRQHMVREITGYISQFGYKSDIILITKNELVFELSMEKSFLYNALKNSLKIYEKN